MGKEGSMGEGKGMDKNAGECESENTGTGKGEMGKGKGKQKRQRQERPERADNVLMMSFQCYPHSRLSLSDVIRTYSGVDRHSTLG